MPKPRIILAGGSGFIGRELFNDLHRDHDVITLTRTPREPTDIHWDGQSPGEWTHLLSGSLAVINLAGTIVNCRYTRAAREEIQQSRVQAVRAINTAIANCPDPPRILIQSSTTAIYGNRGDELLDESAVPGTTFSPETAKLWEQTFADHPTPHTRRVILRMSFVLGRTGGALTTLDRLIRFFLGGTVGTGRQWMSWIHIADVCRIIRRAIERPEMTGIYHVTAPNPVRNRDFMHALRRAIGRPWSPPAPALMVRLGCWLMRTEAELALWGRRCVPKRLADEGFDWAFPDLRAALESLYNDQPTRFTARCTAARNI
jgi:uncharacterized protein (TIGR01777 family)